MTHPRHTPVFLAGLLGAVLLGLGEPSPARAQLVSPGRLMAAHSHLEGLENCTQCHELGTRGTSNARCLNCHEPLAARLAAGTGYHATVADRNCASCHKDHFGLDFDAVRFDTTRFDHEVTGFALTGRHRKTTCRGCHRPALIADARVRAFKGEHRTLEKTFLGLGRACKDCHTADDPHAGQFAGRACASCHVEDDWHDTARFDHADTDFPLTGRHRDVACEGCHRPEPGPGGALVVRYAGLAASRCTACHTDAHEGAFGPSCTDCHDAGGWHRIATNRLESGFAHEKTGFALVGRHAGAACTSCHGKPARLDVAYRLTFVPETRDHTYPRPRADACTDCHLDAHEGVFAGTPEGPACDNCHAETGWSPPRYDLDRHNREAAFALTGAHLTVPCVACHAAGDDGFVFRFEDRTCAACHAADEPHGGQFATTDGATACEDCHTTETWTFDPDFDHDRTRFPLTGRHTTTACDGCHTSTPTAAGRPMKAFRGLTTACADCHATDDPHRGQFEDAACDRCHDTASFHLAAFDHAKTRFPLDGAHRDVACAACHRIEVAPDGTAFTRFKPLGTACRDCHQDEP